MPPVFSRKKYYFWAVFASLVCAKTTKYGLTCIRFLYSESRELLDSWRQFIDEIAYVTNQCDCITLWESSSLTFALACVLAGCVSNNICLDFGLLRIWQIHVGNVPVNAFVGHLYFDYKHSMGGLNVQKICARCMLDGWLCAAILRLREGGGKWARLQAQVGLENYGVVFYFLNLNL